MSPILVLIFQSSTMLPGRVNSWLSPGAMSRRSDHQVCQSCSRLFETMKENNESEIKKEDTEKWRQNREHRWDIWGAAKPSSFLQKTTPGHQGRREGVEGRRVREESQALFWSDQHRAWVLTEPGGLKRALSSILPRLPAHKGMGNT